MEIDKDTLYGQVEKLERGRPKLYFRIISAENVRPDLRAAGERAVVAAHKLLNLAPVEISWFLKAWPPYPQDCEAFPPRVFYPGTVFTEVWALRGMALWDGSNRIALNADLITAGQTAMTAAHEVFHLAEHAKFGARLARSEEFANAFGYSVACDLGHRITSPDDLKGLIGAYRAALQGFGTEV